MKDQRLANFIIAGVNKAGSTSLFHYLSEHPSICGSRDKETCYFLPLLYGGQPGPLSEYAAQFADCSNSLYRMEATPAYIYGKERIAGAIRKTLGPVKVLIILKDPVERLISFYKRKKATLQLDPGMTLKSYVNTCLSKTPQELESLNNQLYTGISLGCYDEYLEPWFNEFGTDLRVVFFDDLKSDPVKFLTGICEWLGIDPAFYHDYSFSIKNRSHKFRNASLQKIAVRANSAGKTIWRKNPVLKDKLLSIYYRFNGKPFSDEELDPEVITALRSYFAPHNIRLSNLLRQRGLSSLPAWLEVSDPVAA